MTYMTMIVGLFIFVKFVYSSSPLDHFMFNGYALKLGGSAKLDSNGLFTLTNTTMREIGHAFYNFPLQPKNSTNDGSVISFSTTFIFAIVPEYPRLGGHDHGLAFVVSPSKELQGALPEQYIGIFNNTNTGLSSNHIVAVELDTYQDLEFEDIDDNHVGIDINGLQSIKSASAGYFPTRENDTFKHLNLKSSDPMQVWVEYNGVDKQLNCLPTSSHYILGWSFKMNGQAEPIDRSRLPKSPGTPQDSLLALTFGALLITRKKKFTKELEDWEFQCGPHKFSHKILSTATKGFKERELLGRGGFGRVYQGVLPTSNIQVAVKRVGHDSRQGMREFVAEIATIGRLRHPNLVRLLGYCRDKQELLLVYDFMPNGSLDKFLYGQPKGMLNWMQRFKIIKDVASGLFYLHHQWIQVVIHRDIKASNILIDNDFNARLGDFGLAKLCDHGTNPQTSHVAGTLGYIAPELAHTGKANTSTDLFAFGTLMLEVVCGRRPVQHQAFPEKIILIDWVFECLERGNILEAIDQCLGTEYVVEEAELVLKLGLLCSHTVGAARPSMSDVVKYLEVKRSLELTRSSKRQLVRNQQKEKQKMLPKNQKTKAHYVFDPCPISEMHNPIRTLQNFAAALAKDHHSAPNSGQNKTSLQLTYTDPAHCNTAVTHQKPANLENKQNGVAELHPANQHRPNCDPGSTGEADTHTESRLAEQKQKIKQNNHLSDIIKSRDFSEATNGQDVAPISVPSVTITEPFVSRGH
ncbi:unnamed protein product [Camellia sinensis]